MKSLIGLAICFLGLKAAAVDSCKYYNNNQNLCEQTNFCSWQPASTSCKGREQKYDASCKYYQPNLCSSRPECVVVNRPSKCLYTGGASGESAADTVANLVNNPAPAVQVAHSIQPTADLAAAIVQAESQLGMYDILLSGKYKLISSYNGIKVGDAIVIKDTYEDVRNGQIIRASHIISGGFFLIDQKFIHHTRIAKASDAVEFEKNGYKVGELVFSQKGSTEKRITKIVNGLFYLNGADYGVGTNGLCGYVVPTYKTVRVGSGVKYNTLVCDAYGNCNRAEGNGVVTLIGSGGCLQIRDGRNEILNGDSWRALHHDNDLDLSEPF